VMAAIKAKRRGLPPSNSLRDEVQSFLDLRAVPLAAILVRKEKEVTFVAHASPAPGIGQKDESKQTCDLRVAG
jgi:hypothetical protein